jgi:RNA polymerase sigma-70 factor (ECF subfamily)
MSSLAHRWHPAEQQNAPSENERSHEDAKEEERMAFLDYWAQIVGWEFCPQPPQADGKESTMTAADVFYAHAPQVYKVACSVLGNEADAEDVAQEVFLRLLRDLGSFRGEARLGSWLHRVTVNAALTYRRKILRRREVERSTLLARKKRVASESDASPAQRLLNKEMRVLIERAIDHLPKIYRDVYVLADIEELSNSEIGKILNIGVPAVKSRLHRARSMMREALARHI